MVAEELHCLQLVEFIFHSVRLKLAALTVEGACVYISDAYKNIV